MSPEKPDARKEVMDPLKPKKTQPPVPDAKAEYVAAVAPAKKPYDYGKNLGAHLHPRKSRKGKK